MKSLLLIFVLFFPSFAVNSKTGQFSKTKLIPLKESKLSPEEKYFQKYLSTAIEEQRLFGIPASITLAQAALESRWGGSTLARKGNNFFGIKCFSKKCLKGHCINFEDDSHKDFFLNFKSPWWSFRSHSKLLSGGRYKSLKDKNYIDYAKGLKKIGYATDKQYDKKLIRLIKRYKLYRYDIYY